MNVPLNWITIIRKREPVNIPGITEMTGVNQNEWIKLYDIRCVDICPGSTARVYNLEHAENYAGNDTMDYVEFHFDGSTQVVRPPYDIMEGDYVGYRQNGVAHYHRIVRRISTPIIGDCWDFQLICNITNPREKEYLMGYGPLAKLEEGDYVIEGEGEGEEGGNNG